MPYRIDLERPSEDAFDTLVDLGALDVEATAGGLAALMPDAVAASDVANAWESRRSVYRTRLDEMTTRCGR